MEEVFYCLHCIPFPIVAPRKFLFIYEHVGYNSCTPGERTTHAYSFTLSLCFSLLSPSPISCQSTPHSKVTEELCIYWTLLRHNPLESICSTCHASRLLLMVQKGKKSKLASIQFVKALRGSWFAEDIMTCSTKYS